MNKLHRFLAAASMVALLGAGCGSSSTPGSPTTGGSGTTGGGLFGGGRESGACADFYAPAGTSISYITRSGSGDVPYTIKVLEHDASHVKMQHDITVRGNTSHINNEFECDSSGRVRGRGYFDLASSMLGIDFDYEVLEMSGDIFPAELAVGTEWSSHTKVKMNTSETSTIGRLMNGAVVTTDITNKVLAEESVTVPAGTFNAFKIQQTVKLQQTLAGRPVNTETVSTSWFVKNVGSVKMQSGTGSGAFSMEAQSITR
jgi:hypothetical protein